MTWSTEGPKNEGRIFIAWCGGKHIFAPNAQGKLMILPYEDPLWFIRLQNMHHLMVEELNKKIDVDAGLEEVKQLIEREYRPAPFED